MVDKKRHILKTISYRLLSSTIGLIIVYLFTNSWKLSASFSLVELVFKPIQYYIHERIWYKYIRYGIKSEKDEK